MTGSIVNMYTSSWCDCVVSNSEEFSTAIRKKKNSPFPLLVTITERKFNEGSFICVYCAKINKYGGSYVSGQCNLMEYYCNVKVFSRCVRNWLVVFLWPVPLWVKVLHWMGTWTRSCGPLPSCTIPHLSMTTKICLIKSPKIPMCSSFQTLQPNLPQDPPNCPCPRDPPPYPPPPSVRIPHHVSVLR